jgi:hypothetical protein
MSAPALTSSPVARFAARSAKATKSRAACRSARAAVASAQPAAPASHLEVVDSLKGGTRPSASTGEAVDASSVIPTRGRVLVPFMTQFADFDSWELAQKLVDDLPALSDAGVTVVGVGIGSVDAAREFARRTNFPLESLYADDTAAAYAALGFAPGFGRAGGEFGWIEEKLPPVSGMAKLMVMCAGVGSPGTLSAVFGGYLGSKYKKQLFNEGSNYDNPTIRELMDVTLGKGYQRPFELATLRLKNMIEIIGDWEKLAPSDDQLLVQRGGSLVFQDGKVAFRHDDAGILGYCDVDRLVEKSLSDDPAAAPDPIATLHAAAKDRSANVDDVYASISSLEKMKKSERPKVEGEKLNGKWRLVYTSGTKKVAANLNKAGFGGSYFPIPAVQSFDVDALRIRNGIYLGPVKFFFDGPFIWRDALSMLEFTFTRVSLGLGPIGPAGVDIDDGKWDAVKAAEQSASSGGGGVEKAKASKPGANPFFKFVYADDKCIAARGRGGGLALWAREGDPETDANEA